MFVKPAPGLQVRDPETKRLISPEGEEVPEISFWWRRIRDKDVIVVEPPAKLLTSEA